MHAIGSIKYDRRYPTADPVAALRWFAASSALGMLALTGCGGSHADADRVLVMPCPDVRRMAVAPVLNFSGETAFDPLRAADLLASELTHMHGIVVIPVNRVAAALDREGSPFVRSPAQAADLCRQVGADGLLIPAVTEYNPYQPMSVGLTLELYVLPELRGQAAGRTPASNDIGPVAQVQRTFNAAHDDVLDQIREFAATRSGLAGAADWRRYLYAQEEFLRFCFHTGLEMMMIPESQRMARGVTTDE